MCYIQCVILKDSYKQQILWIHLEDLLAHCVVLVTSLHTLLHHMHITFVFLINMSLSLQLKVSCLLWGH